MSARARASLAFVCVFALGLTSIALPALGRVAFEAWLWFGTIYFAVAIPILVAMPLAARLVRVARQRDV